MSESRVLTPLESSEYEMIEAAVTESARGRWFLSEYARRNRGADTELLLQAIGRLENAVVGEREAGDVVRLRGDLMEMANAISKTKLEIAAISNPDNDRSRLFTASEALDAIVRATEHATSDILGAAEEIQEVAWTLRENGTESEFCDALDRHATRIYTACSFQDITAQRTSRVVHTLRYLEKRIASMIAIWGRPDEVEADALASTGRPPIVSSPELNQTDVDRFIDMNAAEAPEAPVARIASASAMALDEDIAFVPELEAAAHPSPLTDSKALAPSQPLSERDDLAAAFDDLDNLSIEEKIALFV